MDMVAQELNKMKKITNKEKSDQDFDVVVLNKDIMLKITRIFDGLDLKESDIYCCYDLDGDGALYNFSPNGKISKLLKNKRTYPKVNGDVIIKKSINGGKILVIKLLLNKGISKLISTYIESTTVKQMDNVSDIFMLDIKKAFGYIRTLAISLYVYLTVLFHKEKVEK
jgi:hypothetical protein